MLNLIYAVIGFRSGYFTDDALSVIVVCIPLAVVSTFLGNHLQRHISQERFLKLTYILLLFVGAVVFASA